MVNASKKVIISAMWNGDQQFDLLYMAGVKRCISESRSILRRESNKELRGRKCSSRFESESRSVSESRDRPVATTNGRADG
jgi:hypothetical protein